MKVERDFEVESKVINITVDINNIPDSKPKTKKASIGNTFTAFRNHQNPWRFQTPPKKFQPRVSTSQNSYKGNKIHTNKAPKEDGASKPWQRAAQNFWSKPEGGPSKAGGAGEEVAGAKLVAPIVLKIHQKPNKLVSVLQDTNFNHH